MHPGAFHHRRVWTKPRGQIRSGRRFAERGISELLAVRRYRGSSFWTGRTLSLYWRAKIGVRRPDRQEGGRRFFFKKPSADRLAGNSPCDRIGQDRHRPSGTRHTGNTDFEFVCARLPARRRPWADCRHEQLPPDEPEPECDRSDGLPNPRVPQYQQLQPVFYVWRSTAFVYEVPSKRSGLRGKTAAGYADPLDWKQRRAPGPDNGNSPNEFACFRDRVRPADDDVEGQRREAGHRERA